MLRMKTLKMMTIMPMLMRLMEKMRVEVRLKMEMRRRTKETKKRMLIWRSMSLEQVRKKMQLLRQKKKKAQFQPTDEGEQTNDLISDDTLDNYDTFTDHNYTVTEDVSISGTNTESGGGHQSVDNMNAEKKPIKTHIKEKKNVTGSKNPGFVMKSHKTKQGPPHHIPSKTVFKTLDPSNLKKQTRVGGLANTQNLTTKTGQAAINASTASQKGSLGVTKSATNDTVRSRTTCSKGNIDVSQLEPMEKALKYLKSDHEPTKAAIKQTHIKSISQSKGAQKPEKSKSVSQENDSSDDELMTATFRKTLPYSKLSFVEEPINLINCSLPKSGTESNPKKTINAPTNRKTLKDVTNLPCGSNVGNTSTKPTSHHQSPRLLAKASQKNTNPVVVKKKLTFTPSKNDSRKLLIAYNV